MKFNSELFKQLWYKRNPCHDINTNTNEDMFWETAFMVAQDYQRDISENEANSTIKSLSGLEIAKIEIHDLREENESLLNQRNIAKENQIYYENINSELESEIFELKSLLKRYL